LITPVRSRAERRTFLELPAALYGGVPAWVPPIWAQEARLLDRARHPFHRHAEVEYFLALRDGAPVGRIAAIVNRAHNEFRNDAIGFFGFFDCADDATVAAELTGAAEAWLRARGRSAARGPYNFSPNETCGLLVEGFDDPPYVMTPYHPPYVARLLEGAGYRGVKDLLGYMLREETLNREKLGRVAQIAERRSGVVIRPIDVGRFDQELAAVRAIYNHGWADHWGFVPMTPEEFAGMAADLKPLVRPFLCFIAEVGGKPVGFALAIPEINRLVKKCGGRLFPFGWLTLLWGLRSLDTCRIVALGMLPEYQRLGLGALLYLRLMQDGPANGYHSAELSWILEDNAPMNRAAVEMGGRLYKRWRIYEKEL
jgi:GNAT superfamily N-acetyltransferase